MEAPGTVALARETLAPGPPRRRRLRDRPWWLPAAAVPLGLWAAALPAAHTPGTPPAVWYAALGSAVLLYLAVLLTRRPAVAGLVCCQLVLTAVLAGTAAVAPGGPRWAPALSLLTAAGVHWLAGAFSAAPRARWAAVLLATLAAWPVDGGLPAAALPPALLLLGGLLRTVPAGPAGVRWAPLRRDGLPGPVAFWAAPAGALLLVVLLALVALADPASAAVLLAQAAAVVALLRPARPWLLLAFLVAGEAVLLGGRVPGGSPAGAAGWAVVLMALVGLLAAGAVVAALVAGRTPARVVVPAVLALLAVGVAGALPGAGVAAGYRLALPLLAVVVAVGLTTPSRPAVARPGGC